MVERDPEVAAVWRVILQGNAQELTNRILTFPFSKESVFEVLGHPEVGDLETAFKCLLKNRVQRGGILAPGAGLLRMGENGRGLSSRWYPQTLAKRIEKIVHLRNRLEFIQSDAFSVIRRFLRNKRAAFFVDPPYVTDNNGPASRLYRFWNVDHLALLKLIARVRGACFITYHDRSEVRDIAVSCGFSVRKVAMRTTHQRAQKELVITRYPPE
jgi:DNA adenine methylase